MIDVVTKIDPITKRERLQEADFDEKRAVVRVLPKNDQIRKYLKHPAKRVGFLAEGSIEWPNDAFTRKRIKEGDVTIEESEPESKNQKSKERRALPPSERT